MTVTIDLHKAIERRLAAKAKNAGLDVASYIASVVESHAKKLSLKELSDSLFAQFAASGMTDDELGEFLEDAKHKMRADRRAKGKHVG
jgi:hypothetical protein